MSNHTGTLFRVGGYVVMMLLFWMAVAFGISLLSFVILSEFNYMFCLGLVLLLRTFYPRFVFKD